VEPAIYELPDDFSGEVRVFPLPELVMFPCNVQPLHIFESRYREMLEDALLGDQLIAIATLAPGYEAEYFSRPAVAKEVCLGRVAHHEKTEEGTYNIVLVGMRRARIEQEILPVRSFRRAKVQLLDEKTADVTAAVTQRLGGELTERLVANVPATEKLAREFTDGTISLGTLTDVMAFHLPFDVNFKLTLLAETDVMQRAQLLLANLQQHPLPNTESQKLRPDFSDN
jgi:ATP-dependent Lon protease